MFIPVINIDVKNWKKFINSKIFGGEMGKKEFLYKRIFYITIIVSAVSAYLIIVFGTNINKKYYSGFIITGLLLCISFFYYKKYRYEKDIRTVRESYGNHPDKKNKKEVRTSLFDIKKEAANYYIDEQSFKDLNLISIFNKLNNTFTSIGEEMLYCILRLPLFEKEEIEKRNKYISILHEDSKLREKISYYLFKLSKFRKGDIAELLYGTVPKSSMFGLAVNFMFLLTIGSLAYISLNTKYIFLIMILFSVNYGIHGYIKNKVFNNIEVIRNIGSMMYTVDKISAINSSDLPLLSELKKLNKSCRRLKSSTSILGSIEGVDILADYIRIFFLIEERSYFKSISKISSNLESLKKIYDLLGEIDAYISIASYRTYIGDYTTPVFTDKKGYLNMKDAYHPLVKNPVKNDILLDDNGIILTGSNMSGKSTFLKTIGVNALFSQTIVTVLTSYYEGSLFRVVTSISPEDSILEGKSYYMAEAEALLRITKLSDGQPLLCLIDEIFRGTNPVERISASAEILDYIAKNGGVPIVATHDIELTHLTNHPFNLYYFKEDVGESGLTFDYKIREGISNTQNAIKLLEFLGYPKEITENAYKRVLDEK